MEVIESFITDMKLSFEKISDNTWSFQPATQKHVTRMIVHLEDDVLTFTTPVKELTSDDSEMLLRWNATDMLHAAYGISENMIVLSGALRVEHMDFNEFEAMVDDITTAIDSHFGQLGI